RKEIGRVCCKINKDCMLSDLKIEKSACDANKLFYVTLNFAYKNVSECFTVTGNGVNYGTFKYAGLAIKIGPLKGNCETNYEFVVRDCHNEKCSTHITLGKVCCETQGADCKIDDLVVNALECTGPGQYAIKLDFKVIGTKGVGFDVYNGGKLIGFYPYSSLPIIIKDFKASGNEIDYIKVCDHENEKCCAEAKIKAIKCLVNNPGGFDLKKVEIRNASDQIIIHSDQIIPNTFTYQITDITGRIIFCTELSKDNHQIVLSTNDLQYGIYIINIQNVYDIRNLKIRR
ncbi:MAG: hypothetical protein ABIO44_12105, partial [Saprospiraceae bacterium]